MFILDLVWNIELSQVTRRVAVERRVASARWSRCLVFVNLFSKLSFQSSMAPTKTKKAPTRQAITLKGSTNLVTEFFKYAVNTSVWATAVLQPERHLIWCLSQDTVSTRSISVWRLPHGKKVWTDGVGHARSCIGELSRQVCPSLIQATMKSNWHCFCSGSWNK